MSRLIVPAHVKGKSAIEQQVADARNVLLLQVVVIVPGLPAPVQVEFQNPLPIEMVSQALVKVAFDALGQAKGEDVADRLLNEVSGDVN